MWFFSPNNTVRVIPWHNCEMENYFFLKFEFRNVLYWIFKIYKYEIQSFNVLKLNKECYLKIQILLEFKAMWQHRIYFENFKFSHYFEIYFSLFLIIYEFLYLWIILYYKLHCNWI